MLPLEINFGPFYEICNSNLNVGSSGNLEYLKKDNHGEIEMKFQHHILLIFFQNGRKSRHQFLLRWNYIAKLINSCKN